MAGKTPRRLVQILPTKDIVGIFSFLAVTPAITADDLEKPTSEVAVRCFQRLAEEAYNADTATIRNNSLQDVAHSEVYGEAVDLLTVFGLSRQILAINGIDDFSLKDLWMPETKRLRILLSAMINFCRYKSCSEQAIQEMKQESVQYDAERAKNVQRLNELGSQLMEATNKHSEEMQEKWIAEGNKKERQNEVDRLLKQQKEGERLLGLVQGRLDARKQDLSDKDSRIAALHAKIADLQDQIAESPEGLEREIEDLQASIRQQKARVEEKSLEKKRKMQRVQVLTRLQSSVASYGVEVDRVARAAAASDEARHRTEASKEELADIERSLESKRAKKRELEQAVQNLEEENERLKESHRTKMEEFEQRQQRALQKQQELQDRRNEEQLKAHALQTERLELETAISNLMAEHEAHMEGMQSQLRALRDDDEDYATFVDSLLSQADGDVPCVAVSPGGLLIRDKRGGSWSMSLKCSPAPRVLDWRGLAVSP